jgi:hypothetical protein
MRAMETSNEYLRRAAEAEAKAECAMDSRLKLWWQHCATSWRNMAERAARVEADAPKYR